MNESYDGGGGGSPGSLEIRTTWSLVEHPNLCVWTGIRDMGRYVIGTRTLVRYFGWILYNVMNVSWDQSRYEASTHPPFRYHHHSYLEYTIPSTYEPLIDLPNP